MTSAPKSIQEMSLQPEPVITRSKLAETWFRMRKVARLDGPTYLELKQDQRATGQAVGVLALASLGYGVGFSLLLAYRLGGLAPVEVIINILANTILSLFAALVWAFTAFLVGTILFKGKSTFWELVRPLFFSASPGILFVLLAIPNFLVSLVVTPIVSGWILIGGVLAVKNAMGFGYDRSMLTFIVGVLILILVSGFIRL